MDSTHILSLSALEQARLIATRQLSSQELTGVYLARIEKLNPRLAAFVSVFEDAALRKARSKDVAVARGEALPPFHGVPMGIKDLNFVRGRFTRMGSRAFNILSPVDDRVVSRLRRAGFVFLGKTATPELGALPVTEPDIHAPTRNPWNLDHTPGGSSGGAGAAVASGMLPLAHASDGAGSVRIPSCFCHLFGIKPSRGQVPNAYGIKDPNILYTCGPITRTVADAAAMLDTMSDGRPFPSLLRQLDTPPRPLRMRFLSRSPLATTTPEIEAALQRGLKVLSSLGHEVEEGVAPDITVEEFLPLWQLLVSTSAVWRRDRMQPVTQWLANAGRKLRREDVAVRHHELAQRLSRWWGDADIWVSPTVAQPPPRIGAWKSLGVQETFERASQLAAFTAFFNLGGQPAVNIPLGVDANGLPMGLQLAARQGQDALLLSLARTVEEAMPWAGRTSPVFREA